MAEIETFAEDDGFEAAASPHAFVVDLEGYEGPIDVLLTLAREQKLDLTQISILPLAEQYLAFVADARGRNPRSVRLRIAARASSSMSGHSPRRMASRSSSASNASCWLRPSRAMASLRCISSTVTGSVHFAPTAMSN